MSRILALETSCDETAAAVVEDGRLLRSSVIASQADLHALFGGVVPEEAARRHVERMLPVLRQALDEAETRASDITAVAATRGPGLVGALLVGLTAAKSLALAWDRPLIAVNHLEGHILANVIESGYQQIGGQGGPDFPLVALIVSGGHTELVLMHRPGRYDLLGRTRDDAAGEAFDKVARHLDLGYPGGPAIAAAAEEGDPHAVEFPRAMMDHPGYDFSFSGLKTAVLRFLQGQDETPSGSRLADVAASFQEAVVDILAAKTLRAAREHAAADVWLVGGVAANRWLRRRLSAETDEHGLRLRFPEPELCTDNAAMIAAAAHAAWERGDTVGLGVDVEPALPLVTGGAG